MQVIYRPIRISTLQWVIGAYCVIRGAMVLIVPHQFSITFQAPLEPYFLWIGSMLLLGGGALIAAGAQLLPRAARIIAHLLASGALDDPTGTAKDDITLELEQLASTSDVENELARMKAALGAGPGAAPQAIEGQQPPAQTEQPPTQAAQQPSLDAQSPQEYQAPPSQGQEAPPAQPQGDLR